MTLGDLPDKPEFIFVATNLKTGKGVKFSKSEIVDRKIGLIPAPSSERISLAQVVAASCAFPPFLSPVVIKVNSRDWKSIKDPELAYGAVSPNSELFRKESFKNKLVLADGGLYDNFGLSAIWDDHDQLFISDAGQIDSISRSKFFGIFNQTQRAVMIMYSRLQNMYRRDLFFTSRVEGLSKDVVYWGIDCNVNDYLSDFKMMQHTDEFEKLAKFRTSLDTISPSDQGKLINYGYAMCDAAVASGFTSKMNPELLKKKQWPEEVERLGPAIS